MALQVNIKKIAKLVAAKKWDTASGLFADLIFPLKMNFLEAELPTPRNGIEWVISNKDSCELIFNKSTPQNEYQFYLTRLLLFTPLIKAFHTSKYFCTGNIFISLGDNADASGLALCSNRDDSILVPDTDFLNSNGYLETKFEFMVNSPPMGHA